MLLQVADAFYSALSLTALTIWMQQARHGVRKLAVNWGFCNTLGSTKWQMSGGIPQTCSSTASHSTLPVSEVCYPRKDGLWKKSLGLAFLWAKFWATNKIRDTSAHPGRAFHSPRASTAWTQGYCTHTSSLLAPLNLAAGELGTSVVAGTAKPSIL